MTIGDYGFFNDLNGSDDEEDGPRPSATFAINSSRTLPSPTDTSRSRTSPSQGRQRDESSEESTRSKKKQKLGGPLFGSGPQVECIDLTDERDFIPSTPYSAPMLEARIKAEYKDGGGENSHMARPEQSRSPFRSPTMPSSSQRSAESPAPAARFYPTPREWRSAFTRDAATLGTSRSRTPSSAASTDYQFSQRPSGPGTDPESATLSAAQQSIINHIKAGSNTFFTGSAGTGKSMVVSKAKAALDYMGKKTRLVAPTGRAAYNIGGSTTWSFAGWTPDHMKKPLEELEELVLQPSPKQRIEQTDVLIIDEISMVENHFLERLDAIMKIARASDEPFGGVQLIVSGDFAQLPPIDPFEYCINCGVGTKRNKSRTEYRCRACKKVYKDVDKWAFRSEAWKKADFTNFQLHEIFRQNDPWLAQLLQRMRHGQVNQTVDVPKLRNHACNVDGAVKLYSRNEDVKELNDAKFEQLPGQAKQYWNLDFFKSSKENSHLSWKRLRSKTDDSLVALDKHAFEVKLQLKVGMQVVLLVNLDIEAGLVNGSTGKIIRFVNHDSDSVARRTGRSRHVENDGPRDANDHAERNVAENVPTVGGSWSKVQTEQIKDFMAQERNKDKCLPVVKFSNGLEATIFPFCRISALGDYPPYSLIGRTQIPLAAAWAFTIHKSQGMTMDRVIVDLSKTFEQGQDYVALSRARNLAGLRVDGLSSNFGVGCINAQVKEFLDETFGEV